MSATDHYIPPIPENSLIKDKLTYLLDMARSAYDSDAYEDEFIAFEFHHGASEDKLAAVEAHFGITLDDEHKDLLRFSDGVILCSNHAELYDMNTLISVNDMGYEDSFPKGFIIIGETVGDGEVLCYSHSEHRFITLFEGEITEFDSFSEWLCDILESIKERLEECIGYEEQ